jgi:uncharacterized protein (DUF849 family)
MLTTDKFIVNVCLTGIVASKKQNPFLPVSPEEIAEDVRSCVKLGASMFHLHARDHEGNADWQKEGYEAIIRSIREVSREVIVCFSTSGRRVSGLDKRMQCLKTDPPPDMASVTVGSLNFLMDSVTNTPSDILALVREMNDRGIAPEVEVFDVGMARTVARLIDSGVLKTPCYVNVLLGNIASSDASLLDLAALTQHLPPGTIWCVGGIGKSQLTANVLGMLFGSGARIGLEDNLYLNGHMVPASNAALVERVVSVGKQLGKSPCSIQETREILGLLPRKDE